MSPARLAALAVVALLAVAGAFLLSSQRSLERAVQRGDRILPGLEQELDSLRELRVARADGSRVTLRLEPAGWQVVERGYPADPARLRPVLLALAAMSVVEEKTRDPARYPRIGVEDVAGATATGTLVELTGPQGIRRVILGKGDGPGQGYVRVAGKAESYLATPFPSLDVAPTAWLDTLLVDLAAETLRSATLEPADATLAAGPAPPGARLVDLRLEEVASLPLAQGDGTSNAPMAPKLRVETQDGLQLEISGRRVGAEAFLRLSASAPPGSAASAEAGRLTRRFSDREFRIAAYRYDALFAPAR